MATLIMHPENKEQAAALKAIAKTWKISVETSPYDPDFVDMVKKAEKRGNYKTIDPANVWGSLKLK
jgi:sialic acid synthase SpsE